jgi:hypothetical protein
MDASRRKELESNLLGRKERPIKFYTEQPVIRCIAMLENLMVTLFVADFGGHSESSPRGKRQHHQEHNRILFERTKSLLSTRKQRLGQRQICEGFVTQPSTPILHNTLDRMSTPAFMHLHNSNKALASTVQRSHVFASISQRLISVSSSNVREGNYSDSAKT